MRTSAEYISGLTKMKRNVYVGGEKVDRDDPRLQPTLRIINTTFDFAQNPEYEEVVTATSPLIGKRVNRFSYLHQNPYDLMQKQKMIRLLTQRVGGCILRCISLDMIVALSITTREIDDKYGTEYNRRFLDYLKEYQEKDWYAAGAQTDMKGDRLKRPHEQEDPDAYLHIVEERSDGIVVRGAKICITAAASADELLVIPTRALAPEDKDYAVAFAIPADWDGIRLITRPIWLRERKHIKAPFAEMGLSDCFVIFDNTFIPKERVFMCKEYEFGRRLALLFADSHRFSYCGCKPAMSDILCGITALVAEVNNIERVSHVRQKLSEFVGSGELAFCAGVAAAIYGEKTSSGTYFPNPIYVNIGRRLMGENIYHEFNILTEIAGGLSVTLPFEDDFFGEETKQDLDKYMKRNPKISSEDAHRCWRLVENMVASPIGAWYQIAGVHGGGSPIMETIALNTEYDYESKKNIAKYLAGINKELDQSKDLKTKPTFGKELL